MTCADLEEVACELALDLVTGEERAAAFAHLEECHSCRGLVASLADTADAVLILSPPTEPPAGFASHVLDEVAKQATPEVRLLPVTPSATNPPRWPRLGRLVAALAAVIVGLIALHATDVDRGQGTVMAAEIHNGPNVVGQAYLHRADRNWILLDMPQWAELVQSYGPVIGGYSVAVGLRDGTQQVQALPGDGNGPWRLTLDAPAADVSTVSVMDAQGRVWCTAVFN
jgi:hypothetical protein